jgi:ABC-type antimicrobial peptide transport system permease subunit
VLRLVLAESLLVGGLGTLLGRGTIALMQAFLQGELFVFSAATPAPASLLLAAALGLIIALLSALVPAWQATRVPPPRGPARRRPDRARPEFTEGFVF